MPRVVPQIDALQRIVHEVVQLALGAVVHGARQHRSAHPSVAANGARTDDLSEEHAVPLGEHSFVAERSRLAVVVRQARRLGVLGLRKSGDRRES